MQTDQRQFTPLLAAAALVAFAAASSPLHAQTTAPAAATAEPAEAPKPAQAGALDQQGGMMDRAANSGAQVYVDDSFASIERLRVAMRYASQGQSQLAITSFQGIIDNFGQKLVYLNNDSYVSITDYVRERLLQMPAVQSGMYDQLLGIDAQKLIGAALERHDVAGVMRASDRYFPAKAAFDGLSRAAEWYFERGEFAAASRIWQELLTHPVAMESNGRRRAELLFRAAAAENLNQNHAAANALRDWLRKDFPDATGNVDGQNVKLADKLNEVLALPAWNVTQDIPKDEWPEFQGGPTRSVLPKVDASIGAQLWTVDLRENAGQEHRLPAIPNATLARMSDVNRAQAAFPRLISYPVMSQGVLFVHAGDRVMALSSNAGTPVWAYPQQMQTHAEVVREQLYQAQADQDVNAFRPAAHDSVSVLGDRVFAVLPTGGGVSANEDGADDNNFMPSTRVACLDRATGAEKWSTAARSIKLDTKGSLTFVGSPLVTRQGVFVMARKAGESTLVQLYLVKLDTETGAATWSCYLCSASGQAYMGPLVNFANIPVPTFSDDTIYVSTGQGADCAIDANAGRIIWLQVTEAAKKPRTPQEYSGQQGWSPSWKFNPPLAYEDKLVTCESNGGEWALHIYNRWTGKPLQTITNRDMELGTVDVMAGLIGSRLILTGTSIAALDLDTLDQTVKPAWTIPLPATSEAGHAEGRPFLAATALYVPFEKGMMLVDPVAGKSVDFWQWPKTQKDVPGKPGNLLVTSEQVVVVSDTEVSGYSRWETARDNRLAQIKSHPGDPEPYLALGEIAFRTNHLDLAEENLKKSVDIAGAATPTDASRDVLSRLYRTNLNFAEQLLSNNDASLRDQARFYYEQCKATARTPEQQAEWHLSMSDLSLAQHKPEEAAMLYNEVLTDAALRGAPFHRGDAISRAGVTAELKFHTLVEKNGGDVYKRFEDQAAALLAKGRSQQDSGNLQQVVDAYPNSGSAIAAATDLVAIFRDKQDWTDEIKVLRWLYPHASNDIKAGVTADLAFAHIGLKRYAAALAWAERGVRQYPNFSWDNPSTHEQLTFAAIRNQVRNAGKNVSEGRRPSLPPQLAQPEGLANAMDPASLSSTFVANATLLAPIERAPALNRPDLLFVYRMRKVHVYDAASGKELSTDGGILMPENAPAALLGSSGDISIVVQSHTAIGIDTASQKIAWQIPIITADGEFNPGNNGPARDRMFAQPGGGRIIIRGGGRLVINGNLIASGDPDTDPFFAGSAPDPELARQVAFSRLGRMAFTSMRMIDDKLIVASGGSLTAYSIQTGKPAWTDGNRENFSVKLPGGFTSAIAGNEDLIVAQVDAQDRAGTAFIVIDAQTGKFRKQIKLDSERALWRAVSEDGTLFAVTDQAVVAYDLFSDQDQPLWRQSSIQSRFPYATVLTLDGLILINANSEVVCLSQEAGEVRWPAPPIVGIRLDAPEGGEITYERAIPDGDIVLYQCNGLFSGYHTEVRSNSSDQLAFRATVQADTPPLQDLQISNHYVICLASGPAAGMQRVVQLVLYDRSKDCLLLGSINVPNEPSAPPGDGPLIRAWQVVDNGVAMEINGGVRFYHGKRD